MEKKVEPLVLHDPQYLLVSLSYMVLPELSVFFRRMTKTEGAS